MFAGVSSVRLLLNNSRQVPNERTNERIHSSNKDEKQSTGTYVSRKYQTLPMVDLLQTKETVAIGINVHIVLLAKGNMRIITSFYWVNRFVDRSDKQHWTDEYAVTIGPSLMWSCHDRYARKCQCWIISTHHIQCLEETVSSHVRVFRCMHNTCQAMPSRISHCHRLFDYVDAAHWQRISSHHDCV
jgi:hypothetical protein